MQPRLRIRDTSAASGFAAILVAVLVAATSAYVYLSPPGRQHVTFYTDDAAAIRVGDSVRIAGVPVGNVNAINLEADQVRVRMSVDDSAFVGDQSEVEVRMLTVVGGYYVNIVSLGRDQLGDNTISRERTRMPYSLMQTLADATQVTQRVEPSPVKASADQLQAGLSGTRLDSLRTVIDAGKSLVSTIDRQRGQVSSILNLSGEYLHALSEYRGQLAELIRKAAILEQTLMMYGNGFGGALLGMGEIGQRVKPLGEYYYGHRDEVLSSITEMQDASRQIATQVQPLIDDLHWARTQMEALLVAGDPAAQPPLLATDLCIPIPGRSC